MLTAIRNGSAAIALSLFGAGISLISDHHKLGLWLCALGGAFGFIVVVASLLAYRAFIIVRNGLGGLLVEADELMGRYIKDQDSYDQWKASFNSWFQRANKFVGIKLSPTHAVLFRDLSEPGRYGVRGFNSEHMDYKNSLIKYQANLKRITQEHIAKKT